MPSRWYMASMVKAEFRGALFDGAALVANPAPGADAFVCDPCVKACYGRTGEQVRPPPRRELLLWWFKSRGWNASVDRVLVPEERLPLVAKGPADTLSRTCAHAPHLPALPRPQQTNHNSHS